MHNASDFMAYMQLHLSVTEAIMVSRQSLVEFNVGMAVESGLASH
jgi:hypothetical protein